MKISQRQCNDCTLVSKFLRYFRHRCGWDNSLVFKPQSNFRLIQPATVGGAGVEHVHRSLTICVCSGNLLRMTDGPRCPGRVLSSRSGPVPFTAHYNACFTSAIRYNLGSHLKESVVPIRRRTGFHLLEYRSWVANHRPMLLCEAGCNIAESQFARDSCFNIAI
jgi:hypothetical protein